MEALKLQRNHSQHCGTTTKLCAVDGGGTCAVLLLSIQTGKMAKDWLEISMGHQKGSDWWYRS